MNALSVIPSKQAISFSQAPRIEMCPASEVLPKTRQEEGVDCRYGTIVHAFLRDVSLEGAESALEKVPEEHLDACKSIDLSKLPACNPESFAVEVSFAWDYATDVGREIGRGTGDRDYSSCSPTELAGTADIVGLTEDSVVILDYKTGWRWLSDAAESLQLLGYAVAAARTFKRDRAVVGFIRVPKGAEARFITADLNMLDLDEAAERLRAMVAAVAEQEKLAAVSPDMVDLVEGEHCDYCPAFARCPAKTALLGALAREAAVPLAPSSDLFPMPLTLANFPAVLARWELATDLLERVGKQIRGFAAQPIPIGDGEFYGPVEQKRETFDPVKGSVPLAVHFGPDVANESVQLVPEMTKTAIESALKKWMTKNPGHKITKLKEGAFELIRKAGGSKTGTFFVFKRFRPPKTLKPKTAGTTPNPEAKTDGQE